MALRKVTPVEVALHAIDATIETLQAQRKVLIAQLPRRSKNGLKTWVDHQTGSKTEIEYKGGPNANQHSIRRRRS